MKVRQILVTLFMVLASGASLAQGPTQAYLEASNVGQGFLLKRLDECYLITPKHVVGSDLFLSSVAANSSRSRGESFLIQSFGYDLSILGNQGDIARACEQDFSQYLIDYSIDLSASTYTVATINPDGTRSLTNVDLKGQDLLYLQLKPTDDGTVLQQGMSGSLVYNNNQPVGMLQSVNSKTGQGQALRFDRLIETVQPFFESSVSLDDELMKNGLGKSNANLTKVPVALVSWTNQPLDGVPSVFLVDGDTSTHWGYIHEPMKQARLVVSLGEKVKTIKKLKLTNASAKPTSFIKDFEILVTRTSQGRRGWRSVYSGTWIKNQPVKELELYDVSARRVMLVVRSVWDNPKAILISDLAVISD